MKTPLKRLIAALLVLAMVAMSIPLFMMPSKASSAYRRVADASTMDDWKDYFGKDVLSTLNAGGVWTDKSVLTDASAFDGTGVSMSQNGDSFLVALSAIASNKILGVAEGPNDVTFVEDDENLSGYIAFTDRIGDYMSVTDIKGILIDNTLYSGAMLSRNFVTGGGDLGTYNQPTSLGDELVWAVKARLGIDADTARDLLGLAYYHGQLRYKSDTDFSNYIGWYANAAGEFLGFWYDGMTTMPDVNDPTLSDATRPAYIVRSYGFLGAVDESQGVAESDMMYATVQVREHITDGTEEVLFSVPAALIPKVTYHVTLDEQLQAQALSVSGAEHPIRLVYEVSLDEGIDALTVHEWINNGSVTQHDGYQRYSDR